MIVERNGKFFEIVETEREISEIEYLKRKVKELEDRMNQADVVCPNCPQISYGPMWHYSPPDFPTTDKSNWWEMPQFTCENKVKIDGVSVYLSDGSQVSTF